ncbi:MAG: epimerase [Alteromonadaceae bacterium]|uniref:NAD-dependent epimerase/dehydratase family protein n=1 Tax=Paraglaciecola chathamensis TaxID=368405 RepID=UPI000C405965|nr:NAD-dependent epimerase/dehydratase family protein [Paraglaciecola agarilytica]MBN27813.1 epimerase [Alteromonadaceae bacterium]|tara:strand:+ start:24915 stop:25853 length:939 start_codon:yes stop_codon:yes gene_type:complete
MKNVMITGAGGFVGRHLCELLLNTTDWQLTLLDNMFTDDWLAENQRVTKIAGQLQDTSILDQVFSTVFDVIFHLASLPGGAAEQDPDLSKEVNLDATLDLFERAAAQGNCPRIVFTSTIAVLGAPMPAIVDDNCLILPAMTYGAHKAMTELALADASRRGTLDAVTVRLPGIVARPLTKNGLKSAFLSNAFHLLAAGEAFISPVSEQATMWLMSVQQCAANLAKGATLDSSNMPKSRVVTLPALRISMSELLDEIVSQCGASKQLISWKAEVELEVLFGQQPPLLTPAAEKAGFCHDDDLSTLVAKALLLTG